MADAPHDADLFASYSRNDREFLTRLLADLEERGRTAWVDWEGIPPTAEWFAEITAAIEASGSFLFVISPDSVTSEVCLQELEHAANSAKRIIPVVCRDAGTIPVPGEIAKRQWIFLRPSDDRARGIGDILEALDTDLDWVRFHTRLLVRARQWRDGGRERDHLIRGAELREAEGRRAVPPESEPRWTPLQQEFVTESRSASTRFLRRLAIGVTAALLVTLLATTVAVIQKNRADERLRVALSRQLAFESELLVDREIDTATLLAAAAYEFAPTFEARRELLQRQVDLTGVRLMLHGDCRPSSAAVGPDGRFAAAGGLERIILVWDLESRRLVTSIRGHGNWIDLVAIGPGGRLAATTVIPHTGDGGDDPRSDGVFVWRVASGELETVIRGETRPTALAFSPDGRHLTVTREGGRVTREPVGAGEVKTAPASALRLVPTDRVVYVLDPEPDPVHVEPPSDPPLPVEEALRRIELGESEVVVQAVAMSPDGGVLAVAREAVTLWDLGTGKLIGRLGPRQRPESALGSGGLRLTTSLAFSPDGTLLASTGGAGDTAWTLWDVARMEELVSRPGDIHPPDGLRFAKDGRRLIVRRDGLVTDSLDLDLGRLAADLRGRVNRRLTDAEWERHVGEGVPR